MRVAFVTPNYPNETRVAILPDDVREVVANGFTLLIESGFGTALGLSDEDYRESGAIICSRQECYDERIVFNLKLIQESDYDYLRSDHIIVGWTHPYGSGNDFYSKIAVPLGLSLIDIDSVVPRIFRGKEAPESIDFFPPHMFWKNSYNAGIASIRLSMTHFGLTASSDTSVCVLGSGSVAQGAFHELSRIGFMPRMFYRKTLPIFRSLIGHYDVIVNGIEVDTPCTSIIDRDLLEQTRPDVRLIEAAADAGNAIWGTEYQSLEAPVGRTAGRSYLLVNNAPTIMTAEASRDISAVVAGDILPALARNRDRLGI